MVTWQTSQFCCGVPSLMVKILLIYQVLKGNWCIHERATKSCSNFRQRIEQKIQVVKNVNDKSCCFECVTIDAKI